MNILIASDLHGSAYYTKMLFDLAKERDFDKLLLLGDLLYHGPRNDLPKGYAPKECIAMLNDCKEKLLCVRGNCEAEVDQMVLDFPVMSTTSIYCVDSRDIVMSHGHIYNPAALPPMKEGDLFLYGHTHVPFFKNDSGRFIANPGSVSIPKEGSCHSVVIFNGEKLSWINLETKEQYMENYL
ncbi:MAG: phosphodiesterase [Ruminococcaceae bacterium]|nr:phosphodiesterase [Oscillospiraceae bacterium]